MADLSRYSTEELLVMANKKAVPQQTVQASPKPKLKRITVGGLSFEIPSTPAEEKQKVEAEAYGKQQVADINQRTTARKSLDVYTSDAVQALMAVDKIQRESQNLPKYKRGLLNQAKAKVDTGIKSFAKDQSVTRYMGVVAQELIPMARKLMEEKGPITEFDVARVEKGLGDITTPLEDRIFLLNQFRDKVKQALINKMQVAGMTQEEFNTKYKALTDMLSGQQETPAPIKKTPLKSILPTAQANDNNTIYIEVP